MAIKNPNIEVVEKYINTNSKIMHHCLLHDVYWKTTPARVLCGVGCEICRKEKFRQTRCKTHQQYVEEIAQVNPNIEVVENYVDAKTPLIHHCKKHNIFWNAFPDNVLQGCGCIECGKEKTRDKNKKKHKQYVKELKASNTNIIVIDTYVDALTPIMHKCLVDNHEWYARPANILFGKGCPRCAGNIKRSQEEYISHVLSVNPNIEVLEEYINDNTPILHKCKLHNIQWRVVPNSILQGCGCIECGKEKFKLHQTKSHEQYIKELKEVNPNIVVIENYINATTPILHKCLIDNNEWRATPANILFGTGCPSCNESRGERKIRLWLQNHKIIYEYQKSFKDCRDIKPLPFDFYLPDYNLCIEYDGEQHYGAVKYFGGDSAFKNRVKHDKIKNEYCKNNGISLLRIPYFKNVEEELNNFLFI